MAGHRVGGEDVKVRRVRFTGAGNPRGVAGGQGEVYQSGFARETDLVGYGYVCVHMHRHIHMINFKEVTYTIVGAGSVFCRGAGKLETQASADAAGGGQNVFFLRKPSVVLLRPFN